jgi:hypothetical protein
MSLNAYAPEILLDCVYYLTYAAQFQKNRSEHYKCVRATTMVILDHLVDLPPVTVIPRGPMSLVPVHNGVQITYAGVVRDVYNEVYNNYSAFWLYNHRL